MMKHQIDDTDWAILKVLQENARISFRDLGREVDLSAPAVYERVRKMEEAGVITGYQAVVDPLKVGYFFQALISLKSKHQWPEDYLQGIIDSVPEIRHYWSGTGEMDIILEVSLPHMDFLKNLLRTLSVHGQAVTSVVLYRSGFSGNPVVKPRQMMDVPDDGGKCEKNGC